MGEREGEGEEECLTIVAYYETTTTKLYSTHKWRGHEEMGGKRRGGGGRLLLRTTQRKMLANLISQHLEIFLVLQRGKLKM